MRGECGGGLSRAATRQQAMEDRQTLIIGQKFLYAHRHNVEFGYRGGHVGVPFVGAHHDVACVGHPKVASGEAGLCFHELMVQTEARAMCEIARIVVSFRVRDALLFEKVAHLFARQVERRHDDVTGALLLELHNAFA